MFVSVGFGGEHLAVPRGRSGSMLTARGATPSLLRPACGIDTDPAGSDASKVTTGSAARSYVSATNGTGCYTACTRSCFAC